MTMTAPLPTVTAPASTVRLFAAGAPSYARHLAAFGTVPVVGDPRGLIDTLERSGLQGRGGAGFPTWRKLAALESGSTARPVVIANGAEGEPLSAKDATLLRNAPHLVLDGILILAAATRARQLHLYAGAAQLASVRRAMAERSDAGGVQLHEAPESFISGEASAVVNALERGIALPRDHRERLTKSGLGRRPTLLNNVETLANIALIARFGAEWFRSVGTRDEPGTRLLTVSDSSKRLRVIEVAGGITIAEALRRAAIDTTRLRAVLVGGYHGGWVPASAIETPLTRGGLEPFGASPGAGILATIDRDRCGLQASADIADYLASQSARQCGPCVNGLPAMATVLSRLATRGRDATLPAEIERLAHLVSGRGSCHHPDGTARFVLSSLTAFSADVHHHLDGRCERERR